MPGENTIEYQTILQCRESLMLAVQYDLAAVSSRMMEKGLITIETSASMNNPMLSISARASTLLDLLQWKVHADVENYKVFVDDILGNSPSNGYITDHLKMKYDKLKGML